MEQSGIWIPNIADFEWNLITGFFSDGSTNYVTTQVTKNVQYQALHLNGTQITDQFSNDCP